MKSWKTIIALAAACFASWFWETTAQETLTVQYTDKQTISHTLEVEKDVKVLGFDWRITSLTLPEGLSSLKDLYIGAAVTSTKYIHIAGNASLTSLTLPKDFLLSWRTTTEPSHVMTPIPASVRVFKVYGYSPRITHREDGMKIVWEKCTLQSAPTLNGPWQDVPVFDDTRRVFLRSSSASPAAFFRVVKP